jgi:isoleucyl-tRNA synthetase
VTIRASSDTHALLERFAADLPMLFITSSVDIARADAGAPALSEVEGLEVTVDRADGEKCPRCWRFVTETVPDGDLAGLCLRCADAVGAVDDTAA